jgi:8-oxo-dGTP pyrophosphatase MutT (NUDIX family)
VDPYPGHSDLVPICVKEFGFYIHHAKKKYVMLVKWTHPLKSNPIPAPSTHQVGVGALIMRGDRSVLLVREVSGPASVGGIWKLPTGLTDPHEDLDHAAVREVKEETGLDCVFDSIVLFRHSHGGCPTLGAGSDLFFVCLLSPLDESQPLKLQESEILDARWVGLEEIDEVTRCGEGTAAKALMDRVKEVVSGQSGAARIRGVKLPAWRRKNCDQWIFQPTAE